MRVDTWQWADYDSVMWGNHLISNAGVRGVRDTGMTYHHTIMMPGDGWPESYQYQESVINTRHPHPDWRHYLGSHYPRLHHQVWSWWCWSDQNQDRGGMEERAGWGWSVEGTRWHQDKERWMVVVATGDKHWQELTPEEGRERVTPSSKANNTSFYSFFIDQSHALNFSLELLYCRLGQSIFCVIFQL